jgi:hypothetical protein
MPAKERENKKSFSTFDLSAALDKLGIALLSPWKPDFSPKLPGAFFLEKQKRLEAFGLTHSEGAKTLIIDALFEEAIQPYHHLRIFKEASLQGTDTRGVVDYLIAVRREVPGVPFLCVAEAKKDDFEQGTAQCLVEMQACAEANTAKNIAISRLYGIVTNGDAWRFYRRDASGDVFQTVTYALSDIPDILGILDSLLALCNHDAERLTAK